MHRFKCAITAAAITTVLLPAVWDKSGRGRTEAQVCTHRCDPKARVQAAIRGYVHRVVLRIQSPVLSEMDLQGP